MVYVRQALPMDAQAMSRIFALSWKSAYRGIVPDAYLDALREDFWTSAFSGWFEGGDMKGQMIYEGSRAVGAVVYGPGRDARWSDWGEVVAIYVHPHYQGRGFGTKLLEVAVEDLRSMGYARAYLWVLEENLDGRLFYEANGWDRAEESCVIQIMNQPLVERRYTIGAREGALGQII
ncbi:MAG: GNAT family N-acetyltransferase [Christensenellales bacterium]|jgi:GNAT superfamily N-acetyltransferase